MPRLRIGQLGFMDAAVSKRRRAAGSDVLERIGGLVDQAALEGLLPDRGSAALDETAYPSLTLFKAPWLQTPMASVTSSASRSATANPASSGQTSYAA